MFWNYYSFYNNLEFMLLNMLIYILALHLSNQNYNICIRKPSTANRICYIPCTNIDATIGAAANVQASFGIRWVVPIGIYDTMLHSL